MLTLDTFTALLTPRGHMALAAAEALQPTDAARLHAIAALRKAFPPDLAAAALETALLRHRARAKFRHADQMYFTREALEQASGETVARYRAERYRELGAPVADVCCSIGGDALQFATAGLTVHGIDRDPLRIAMAQANAAVYGVGARATFTVADALQFEPQPGAAIFFDPARRRSTKIGTRARVARPESYEPPLSLLERWLDQAVGIGVKVAPGIDYDALPYDCEVEIISVAGEVKEACLWFGALKRGQRTATLLPGGAQLHVAPVPPIPVAEPRGVLYEPEGAVIRAHLVEQLADHLGAAKIDPTIAFLTRESYAPTPFARAFRIVETLPFNLKRLRTRLRELDVGRIVVKKRGSPIDPQALERQLRLERNGARTITIVLTQVRGQPTAILCDPVAQQEAAG